MPLAQNKTAFANARKILLAIGLIACAGTLVVSPADAQRYRQRGYADQWSGGGVTARPRYTPEGYLVCWNGCGNRNSIVMGADPDPFIRSQILRDASGFFGGGSR